MPHPLTESNAFDATITVPDDGDAAVAASVNTPLQSLANRSKWLHETLMRGSLLGGRRIDCYNGGASATSLSVDGIVAAHLGAGSPYAGSFAASVGAAQLEGGGSLPATTWLYLYAYVSGGSLAYQLSTTPPDGALVWKSTGTGTHRYLGCVYSISSTSLRTFQSIGPRVVYYQPPATASVTATSWTAVSLTGLVPTHARVVRFGYALSFTSGNGTAQVRLGGDATSARTIAGATSTQQLFGEFSLPIGTAGLSTAMDAQIVGGTGGSLSLLVLGFDEQR